MNWVLAVAQTIVSMDRAHELNQCLKWLVDEQVAIVAYIRTIVQDPHAAEDVFQNVALVAVRKRPSGDQRSRFIAWARAAARLEALNWVRRQRRAPRPLDAEALERCVPKRDGAMPELRMSAVELLHACVDRLPPHSRRMLDLRYVHGEDCTAIATRLNRSVGAVYVTFNRIHRQLERCMLLRERAMNCPPP